MIHSREKFVASGALVALYDEVAHLEQLVREVIQALEVRRILTPASQKKKPGK